MSKYYNQQSRDKKKSQEKINDVFWWVYHLKASYEETNKMITERVFLTKSWGRLSSKNKNYLLGRIDEKIDLIWRNEIEWMLGHPDGLMRGDDIPDGEWHLIDGKKSKHIWKGRLDRPWTKSEEEYAKT